MPAMTVTIWGARGSVPTPGANYAVYGGNTPCVAVRAGDEVIILDAGTGLVPLGRQLLAEGVTRISLLLSHLHHDHIGGLPFFAPLFAPEVRLTIHCGHLAGETAHAGLEQAFSPPLFPLPFSQLARGVTHRGFVAGEPLEIGDVRIATQALNHPGGATAYRLERAGKVFTYATDVEHLSSEPDPAMVRFVKGSDLLFYDMMMTPDEMPSCAGWGHSTWLGGAELAEAAQVARLGAFHHNPLFDDARLAGLEAALQTRLPQAFYCREGQTIAL